MKIEGNLGTAIAVPAVALAAVFAPQTLLYAVGMYAVGKLAGAYFEAATYNAAQKVREDYEDSGMAADLAEAGGHIGGEFVKTASMFCPVLPLVAVAAGRHLNKKTFPKDPVLSDRPAMDLRM